MVRNIHGDAAWPPVRPPSSGPSPAYVEADDAAVTARAQQAWSSPIPIVTKEDIDAAMKEAMSMIKPRGQTAQVCAPLPLCAALSQARCKQLWTR